MDKMSLLPVLIEAVIFLIPFVTIFIKMGQYKQRIDDMEERTKGLAEFKTETTTKVNLLETCVNTQTQLLKSIENQLVSISTKVELILDDRIKSRGDKSDD